MAEEVLTVTLAEAGTAEDTANEAITDLAFVPLAPVSAPPAAYSAATTYAKGALALEGTTVYRSQVAGNKANEPKADTDFVNWAPVGIATFPLQNPAFGFPTAVRTQPSYNKPPASSSATAKPSETVNPGDEAGFGQ